MKKVLLIEDNPSNRYLVRFILKNKGIETIEVSTGKEGVAAVANCQPDLIIVDIQLPDINGLEVTRRIRGTREGDKFPIVALTSYAMPGDREDALRAGCSGYMEKPITPETFMEQIEDFMKGGTGATGNESFSR